ncbi:Thiolase, N-terminal domain-containing protein [Coprinopsis sp. MPI-PUGE-AT-0042]|nr:Thiolase, N-terminal domain-containing protein [Coprinopsis sp. MPI-PUGE-AT-0042]
MRSGVTHRRAFAACSGSAEGEAQVCMANMEKYAPLRRLFVHIAIHLVPWPDYRFQTLHPVFEACWTDENVATVSAFRSTITKPILSHIIRTAYIKVNLDGRLIEDIAVSNVLPPGGGASAARMTPLHAGIPVETATNTVNRQCSSGLTAVSQIANEIKLGQIDIGIGAGVESMTHGYGAGAMGEFSDEILENKDAEDCLLPMGITSENVAADYGITRDTQDAFAARSFQKAAKAQKEGKFKDEIVPIKAKWVDPKTEKVMEVVVDHDDGVRDGNASQVSDGAAAVLLARRSVDKGLGLPIVGKFITSAVVGVPPRVMGIGPAFAIPRVLQTAQISPSDVDFYEINKVFASQAVMSIQHLKIPEEKVNLNGGGDCVGTSAWSYGCTTGCDGSGGGEADWGKGFRDEITVGGWGAGSNPLVILE